MEDCAKGNIHPSPATSSFHFSPPPPVTQALGYQHQGASSFPTLVWPWENIAEKTKPQFPLSRSNAETAKAGTFPHSWNFFYLNIHRFSFICPVRIGCLLQPSFPFSFASAALHTYPLTLVSLFIGALSLPFSLGFSCQVNPSHNNNGIDMMFCHLCLLPLNPESDLSI